MGVIAMLFSGPKRLSVMLGVAIALYMALFGYLLLALILAMGPLLFGLVLVGGAMFGLGFLTSLWLTFGAVWVKAEPTYWPTFYWTTTATPPDPRDAEPRRTRHADADDE